MLSSGPTPLDLQPCWVCIFSTSKCYCSFPSYNSPGTFTSLYKFLINALPIIIPAIRPRHGKTDSAIAEEDEIDIEAQTTLEVPLEKRKGRLSLTRSAQLVLVRKQTRRWHAALAGAVAGGLAIMWETRSRRGVIAQQLFVRSVFSIHKGKKSYG